MAMMAEMDRFEALIRDSLQDDAAREHLSGGFSDRMAQRVVVSSGRSGNRHLHHIPRWAKVAAIVVLMMNLIGFAAWFGASMDGRLNECVDVPVGDPETEAISKQGDNTMIARKMAALVGAAMVSVAVPAEELMSEPTFVFLRPETSSFWNTATNNTMEVPIDYPNGATRATLAVSGVGYDRVYSDITDDAFVIELPAATSPETENVYDLVLTFNDASKTTRTAKLGLVQGLSPDAEGITRCLAPSTARVWRKVQGRTVLPIPYGTTSFTINGTEIDTGLGGAQGWYALGKIGAGENASLSIVAGGVEYMASLLGAAGMMVIFR